MAKRKPKLTEKKIRESLEQQLRDKGADVAHFQDMLDRYMFFWRSYKENEADYTENGKMIQVTSAAGKLCDKENPAIKQAAICDQSMRAIMKDMGLTTDSCRPPDDDGGDLG